MIHNNDQNALHAGQVLAFKNLTGGAHKPCGQVCTTHLNVFVLVLGSILSAAHTCVLKVSCGFSLELETGCCCALCPSLHIVTCCKQKRNANGCCCALCPSLHIVTCCKQKHNAAGCCCALCPSLHVDTCCKQKRNANGCCCALCPSLHIVTCCKQKHDAAGCCCALCTSLHIDTCCKKEPLVAAVLFAPACTRTLLRVVTKV